MNNGADIVCYALALILPLSALLARRLPVGQVVRMALGWVGIFTIATLVVAQRDRIAPIWQSMHDAVSGRDRTVTGRALRIAKSDDGHFYVDATVNGVHRRMLVDSGASTTALSTATARAAGIDLDESVFPRMIDTANGTITARTATLKRMTIGDNIVARDLPIVVADAFGDTDVVGMNFLSKLDTWRVEGNVLILTPNRP